MDTACAIYIHFVAIVSICIWLVFKTKKMCCLELFSKDKHIVKHRTKPIDSAFSKDLPFYINDARAVVPLVALFLCLHVLL
ncbi:hypothetical protein CN585_19360 [Bacillus toyonensis]|uniref:Uncharacterized protein n=1 Tax=Bacillus toyonensis TaxID=155322 RepID=A0A2A8HD24_9BACI|nr:hypothetical protein CN585_19360 [Bacillus toyonensis]